MVTIGTEGQCTRIVEGDGLGVCILPLILQLHGGETREETCAPTAPLSGASCREPQDARTFEKNLTLVGCGPSKAVL